MDRYRKSQADNAAVPARSGGIAGRGAGALPAARSLLSDDRDAVQNAGEVGHRAGLAPRAGADRAACRDQQQGVRRLSRKQGVGGRGRAKPFDGIDAARCHRDPYVFHQWQEIRGAADTAGSGRGAVGLGEILTARGYTQPAMQVERPRLPGFKSFVDPTELVIAPGLTGIVGPNGCGKSNLVEALRWVMGESSAKRLRGGEMDDVIFGGSGSRPARNLAEVVLTLDNSVRDAPLAFNDTATIEVARRIVRGAGSAYRVNGREALARDVQLLFADAASGPHSGALVGQGRIGALIAAQPRDRRALLDEAAGTSGLYARRHDAELKLRAAEDNLARLDDLAATLLTQSETLKKQARQATRYRRLGEQIRETEAQLSQLRWRLAADEAALLAAELQEAERQLS